MPAAPRAKSASYTSLGRPLAPAFIRAQTERLERQRRAEAALARAEASLARMQRARQHLPLRFPDPQEAAALRPTLWPEGFRRETDPAVVARVHEALSKAPRFAAALDTDPHDRRWALYAGLLGELLEDTPPPLDRGRHPDRGFPDAGVAEAASRLRRQAGVDGPFPTEGLHRAVAPPVAGLCPSRSGRSWTLKRPNPARFTSAPPPRRRPSASPPFGTDRCAMAASTTAFSAASITPLACFLSTPCSAATRSANSAMFMLAPPSLRGRPGCSHGARRRPTGPASPPPCQT